MSDPHQYYLRDYAKSRLLLVESRADYVSEMLAFAHFNGADETGLMMALRIANHMWDSTPHKVIDQAHLSPDQIPAGTDAEQTQAKSPAQVPASAQPQPATQASGDPAGNNANAGGVQASGGVAKDAGARLPSPGAAAGSDASKL